MKPVIETVITFLKSMGWKLDKTTDRFQIMTPPENVKSDADFVYRIPLTDLGSDYKEYMTQLIFSIADLYEMNKWELLELLSKSLISIQRDVEEEKKLIELKQRLLAHAS